MPVSSSHGPNDHEKLTWTGAHERSFALIVARPSSGIAEGIDTSISLNMSSEVSLSAWLCINVTCE